MKDLKYYETNPIEFKQAKDFYNYNAYKDGVVLGSNLTKEQLQEIKEICKNPIVETIDNKDAYNAWKAEYSTNKLRLEREFWNDLAEQFEVTEHPKRQILQVIVKEMADNSGDLDELYNLYSDLVVLIK